ncbi:MAG: hypothetical protein NT154_29290 [Verrucomicrobia bacterium]|nr:hypothetical protein [Verrucomicrobiota bacterium]
MSNRYLVLVPFLAFLGGLQVVESPAASEIKPLFTPEEVAEYKPQGPSARYRYLCPDYNLVGGKAGEYFTQADPAEYAEFCKSLNLDAALLLAVPTEGYCAYETKVGQRFPNMKGDWFGQTVKELHRRGISAFAYVTLGWNLKYAAEHPKYKSGDTICFNSPYADLVIAYHQEILKNYPVDGIRNDIYWQGTNCRCDGCKTFYHELYGEELPPKWADNDWRRMEEFRRATLVRIVRRISEASKAIKPSVEIWENQLNIQHNSPLEALRFVDAAYMEFGEPFGLLFHAGWMKSQPVIVGKLENLPPKQMRLCMALGARGYTYIKSFHTTALPPVTEAEAEAFRARNGWNSGAARQNARSRGEIKNLLGKFYGMIADIQPYLEGACPVYHSVGVVYCESTRYRFKGFDRAAYSKKVLQPLADAYLARSVPLEFLDNSKVAKCDLGRYKCLVLPETSGLTPGEVAALKEYVGVGGQLLLAGGALCYDENGLPLQDFALAHEMDVSISTKLLPKRHEQKYGNGKIVYLASPYDTGDLVKELDTMVPECPVTTSGAGTLPKQAILTWQKSQKRWILHLISDGDYTVDIRKDFAAAARIAGKFPSDGWEATLAPTATGVRIKVQGNANDRLLVLD